MSKDPLSGRLAKSLQAETEAVDNRFARAESVLGGGQGTPPSPRHAKSPPSKKRIKVIRDTFSFPESEFALLAKIQHRCLNGSHNATKSELVRAGLSALAGMNDAELLAIVRRVEKLKPGSRGKNS